MSLEEIISRLEQRFESAIRERIDFREETTLIADPSRLVEVLNYCKGALEFDYLIDISSVDLYDQDPRFEVVYELYSLRHHNHLRIKIALPEDELEAPSVAHLWKTANWHEREIYDMMGIRFSGHPDLRRILMWEGYPYYPLRKDFPLEGKHSEVPDVAFTEPAPLEGGPFVTLPSDAHIHAREPRARRPEELAREENVSTRSLPE